MVCTEPALTDSQAPRVSLRRPLTSTLGHREGLGGLSDDDVAVDDGGGLDLLSHETRGGLKTHELPLQLQSGPQAAAAGGGAVDALGAADNDVAVAARGAVSGPQ